MMTVDLSRSYRGLLDGAVSRARGLQSRQQWEAAAAAWDEAARLSTEFAKFANGDDVRQRRLAAADDFRRVAARLRKADAVNQPGGGLADFPVRRTSNTPAASGSTDENAPSDEYREAARLLMKESNLTFSDIAGLDETKLAIQSALALSIVTPPPGVQLSPVRNILFYGPPGCGKTLLAAAACNGLDVTFFAAKVGDLMSRYFGESSKLVQALYDVAREQAPSVVFLDEADALMSARQNDDSGSERRMLVSFLTELDGLPDGDDESYVMTVAATNAPWDLDAAILSRFERRIYVPLPDQTTRRQILASHLTNRGHELTTSLDWIAERTAGMSGRELERLSKLLVERMIASENPELGRIAMQGRQALSDWQVQLRAITENDVLLILEQSVPETSVEMVNRYEAWGRDAQ